MRVVINNSRENPPDTLLIRAKSIIDRQKSTTTRTENKKKNMSQEKVSELQNFFYRITNNFVKKRILSLTKYIDITSY